MNPRSLKEPEAAKAAAETTTDPVVCLAQRYVQMVAKTNSTDWGSDEELNAFCDTVVRPLERELMEAHPTSREGIAALLDLALGEYRSQHGDPAVSDEVPHHST